MTRPSASRSQTAPVSQVPRQPWHRPRHKARQGRKAAQFSEDEKYTYGLDDLPDRLEEYYELGCRFTKWRTVITVDESRACPRATPCASTRRTGALRGDRPEPGHGPGGRAEAQMKGYHHPDRVPRHPGDAPPRGPPELVEQRVSPEGMLLKTSMVMTGFDSDIDDQAGPEEVAERTLECMYQVVPAAVPGIVFLSGGQSDQTASANLNEMVKPGTAPRGRSASPTRGRCRACRWRSGAARTRRSRTPRRPSTTGPASPGPRVSASTQRTWRHSPVDVVSVEEQEMVAA